MSHRSRYFFSFAGGPVLAYLAGAMAHPLLAQSGAEWGIIEKLLQPSNLAASTLLFFNVIGFMKGWIVPKYVYDAERSRADRMEARAMEASNALKASVESVENVARAVMKQAGGAAT